MAGVYLAAVNGRIHGAGASTVRCGQPIVKGWSVAFSPTAPGSEPRWDLGKVHGLWLRCLGCKSSRWSQHESE
jgi:hypothetical protein